MVVAYEIYSNQIKSSLYLFNYAEACDELAVPISASLLLGRTALFQEIAQGWQSGGNTVYN